MRERKYTAQEVEEILEHAARMFESEGGRTGDASDDACQRIADKYRYVARKFAGWAAWWSEKRRVAV